MAVRLLQEVRYVARSHGWRCDYYRKYGMSQGARDGGVMKSDQAVRKFSLAYIKSMTFRLRQCFGFKFYQAFLCIFLISKQFIAIYIYT